MLHDAAMLVLSQSSDRTPLVVAIGALILAVVMLAGVLMLMRRWFAEQNRDDGSGGLSIAEIRRMHRMGQLTDEEFVSLRRAALLAAGVAPDKIDAELGPARPQPADPHGGKKISMENGSVLRARPGYDLTGAPLPAAPSDGEMPRGEDSPAEL